MDEVALHPTFRSESASRLSLSAGELHVWAVPLSGDNERYAALLSAAEQDRASRFRVADHRRRYAISHGALRVILAGYLARDPQALQFATSPRGKPSLIDPPGWHFNLSHSAQLALVAVGHAELGVDLEKRRHLESLKQIATRHFSQVEVEALRALPAAEQLGAFYRCWTRKEAYVKAIGSGLSSALDVFDVSIDADARFLGFRSGNDVPEDWSLFDVSPSPDYTGALAIRARSMSVRTFALLDG